MLLYGSIRSAPIGEPGATYTIQNYVNAYFDKEFYLVLLNSLYYGIGNLHRILLYSYISTVLSIMAFDLWEGGQYTYVCALGVLMVLLLIAMAFTARTVGAKVGIAA
jgi:hypothetical protein